MKIVLAVCLVLCVPAIAGAQQNPSRAEINEAAKKLKTEQAAAELVAAEKALAARTAAEAKTAAARTRRPVNIKVEFTLTDQRGTGAPSKRTVSAVVADGSGGQIRSSSDVVGVGGGVTLNIDTN